MIDLLGPKKPKKLLSYKWQKMDMIRSSHYFKNFISINFKDENTKMYLKIIDKLVNNICYVSLEQTKEAAKKIADKIKKHARKKNKENIILVADFTSSIKTKSTYYMKFLSCEKWELKYAKDVTNYEISNSLLVFFDDASFSGARVYLTVKELIGKAEIFIALCGITPRAYKVLQENGLNEMYSYYKFDTIAEILNQTELEKLEYLSDSLGYPGCHDRVLTFFSHICPDNFWPPFTRKGIEEAYIIDNIKIKAPYH